MLAAAVALAAVGLSVGVTATVLLRSLAGADTPQLLADAASPLVTAAVATLLTTRLPRNPIGWLMLFSALDQAVQLASGSYAADVFADPQILALVAPLSGFAWLVGTPLFALLVQIFPTGRPLTRRWWALVGATGMWIVGLPTVVRFASTTTLKGGAFVPNPDGLRGPIGDALDFALLHLVLPYFVGFVALSVLSVVIRYARARGIERQQLKWLLYAAVLSFVLFLAGFGPGFGWVPDAVSLMLDVAVAIAILRYRLYDIDLLINRTVVYGLSTAAIAATFFLGIVALQAALRPLTAGSELAVAVSTLVSFALFQPVRRRVQDAVDRRFDRSRYDAARTLELFADRLRDEVDLDALRADLLGAVRTTMAPAHASLWLREGAG
jgi:hypothetical protein